VIFPAFFEKQTQSLVEQFQAGKEQTEPVPVVSPFHFLERLKAPIQQNVEIGRFPQFHPTLGTVQIVGRHDVGATRAETDFHGSSLGQPLLDSNPFSTFLSSKLPFGRIPRPRVKGRIEGS